MFTELKESIWSNVNVRVRQDTEFGHLVKRIEERVFLDIPSDITYDELKCSVLDKLSAYFSTEDGAKDLATLQSIGLKLGDMFLSALDTLKGKVADEVSVLSEKILATAEEYSTKRITGNSEEFENAYVVLTIGDISKTVASSLKELLTKYNLTVDSFNPVTANKCLSSVPEITELTGEGIDAFVAEFANKTDNRDVKSLCKTIFSLNSFRELKLFLFSKGIMSGKVNEATIVANLSFCNTFPEFVKLFNSIEQNFSEEVRSTISKNMSILSDLHIYSACVLELSRQKYKDTLVIGKNLLNGDKIEEFKQAGGTLEDISNHLRLYYNTNENDILFDQTMHQSFPVNGISTKEILVAYPENRTKLNTLMDAAKIQLSAVKQTCTRDAFVSTLKQYISDVHKSAISQGVENAVALPTGMNPEQFVKESTDQVQILSALFNRNTQTNIEDLLYSFYLNTWMRDSLVSTIYYQLGAEALTKLSQTENPDTMMLQRISVSVMADILSSYLAKTFVIPC